MLSGTEIVVGVTGGIAAFKTAAMVSKLVQDGAGVSVVMTEAACRFIGPPTFEALTGRPVYRTVFDNPEFPLGAHIGLAEKAQLLCIAPTTADFMSKAAHGAADDLLSTLYLALDHQALRGRVLMAPAMNTQMWAAPAVARNVAQLKADGVTIIEPGEGWLSCRTKGTGRMAEPEAIRAAIEKALA
ncbi:MAG: phosphopantothenoylcysteine decarboxylase [Planctomycetales bacterium]|nr:phosphopantothenoylcysteine decarboxylase [Planctomycetales bacterium]